MKQPFVGSSLFVGIAITALSSGKAAWAEDEQPIPKPRPTAADTRAGRPTLAMQLGWQTLLGSAEDGSPQSDVARWGPGLEGQIAYPLNRHFALEAWGSWGSFRSGTDLCPSCTARSFALGASAVYHLVDGIPFDPWFSAGLGYRTTHLTYNIASPQTSHAQSFDYYGIELPKIAIGSDYYPVRQFGFGPFLDLSFGEYLSRKPGIIDTRAIHSTFTMGIRVILNPFAL